MPEQLARAVVAEQATRAEEADDTVRIRRRSGLGVTANAVDLFEGRGRRRGLPEDAAVLAVQGERQQALLSDGGQVDAIADNNWRGMSRRQRRLPQDVG